MKTKLTKVEKRVVRSALNFYIYETTHYPTDENGTAGLRDGKEKRILLNALEKLK